MLVVFDSNVLLPVLRPGLPPPLDPKTGKPVEHFDEKLAYLVGTLSRSRSTILIPAPVLTEVLCRAGAAGPALAQQLQQAPFQVAPFDIRAAIDCADLLAFHFARKGNGRSKSGAQGAPGGRDKVKFDRQVVAIAKSRAVDAIYSDDEDVAKEGARVGVKVVRTSDLERDPATRQGKLDLKHPETDSS
jgi:hypothetical protein